MAIVDTDWKAYLAPDSDLPPDVTFLVTGEDGNPGKAIKAHKQFLAGVSPMFMKQFFGPMKEEKEVINVKNTSAEAFQTMIDFIYRHPKEDAFPLDQIKCAQKLCEVLELAERYQILALKTLVKEAVRDFDVTRKNIIFTATVAKNYKVMFDDIYESLSVKCLKFLYSTAENFDDMFALMDDTMENFPEASLDILLELKKVKDERLPGKESNRSLVDIFLLSL